MKTKQEMMTKIKGFFPGLSDSQCEIMARAILEKMERVKASRKN